MGTHVQSVQQQVIHLISRIQCEEIRRAREEREINRQNITVPVTIRPFDGEKEIDAISRDISSLGIGLLASQPVAVEQVAELELELDTTTSKLVGTCRYCKPFGKGYYITGWRFENVTS